MVKKAFTLVELLVVISVISLLMAVLLPALGSARQQGKFVFCLNNLRQMAIAANTYVSSNNDYYPLAYYNKVKDDIMYYYSWDFISYRDWSTSPPKDFVEPGLLWQGGTIEKVHQCPAFKGEDNWFADPYTGYNYNTSYIGRDETVDLAVCPPTCPGIKGSTKATQVKRPSETAVFGDGEMYSEDVAGANKFMRAPFSNPRDASFSDSARAAGAQGYRHLGKTNVAFCDGHVKSWKDLFTNTDHTGKEQLDKYNETHDVKIGFLSEDNSVYDLQ